MTNNNINDLKKLTREPPYTFVAIKNIIKDNHNNEKLDLLAFIMEKGSNYSENLNTMKYMVTEKKIPMDSEVLLISINNESMSPDEVELMAQDIVDAIYSGEESDYDPVTLTLGEIID